MERFNTIKEVLTRMLDMTNADISLTERLINNSGINDKDNFIQMSFDFKKEKRAIEFALRMIQKRHERYEMRKKTWKSLQYEKE